MKVESETGVHTHAEILSQPEVWQDTLDRLGRTPAEGLPDLRSYDQVLFVGCGSTYFLSRWAARHCQGALGICAGAAPSSELLLFPASWLRPESSTLLVAISRSAETSETIRAVESFSRLTQGDSIALTCNPDRSLAGATRWVLAAPEAKEQSVAQTRSFTSMMLLAAWLIEGRRIPGASAGLPAAGRDMLERSAEIAASLGRQQDLQAFYFLGSGPRYGLACEGMLKMKEMSLSHSQAYHFMEIRHGPKSMVGADSLVIGLAGETGSAQERRVIGDMRQLGASTLALGPQGPFQDERLRHPSIVLPNDLPPIWREPLYLPGLQLLAYHRAMSKGLNPDRPANLEAVVKLDE